MRTICMDEGDYLSRHTIAPFQLFKNLKSH
nr:MAG TPA: hypothetical protein [Caudoviricetes sp.]